MPSYGKTSSEAIGKDGTLSENQKELPRFYANMVLEQLLFFDFEVGSSSQNYH